jgi:SAM-dependent methyltransferase
MFDAHLHYLVCPKCKKELQIEKVEGDDVVTKSGSLICTGCAGVYPIINQIPRFVDASNYADSFGFEWLTHKKTQYDHASGIKASEERFAKETRWGDRLDGQIIIEAGSGSGRFTKHALQTGAFVISFDYSQAVEANFESNGKNENLLLVQASIYEMPFADDIADKLFCFGVLQHTPDARKAIISLVQKLKKGGELVCDHYPFNKNTPFNTKYWVRPITKRLPHRFLYNFGKRYIDFMWPIFKLNRRIFSPKRANRINWRLLIPDYTSLGLDESQLKEWAYLDFFDMLSPAHDHPVRLKTFKRWLEDAGLEDVDAHPGYNGWEGRGIKK